jgi:hypothetical protein
MTMTAEQSRALIDAIAVAPTPDALEELRRQVRRECGLDGRGSFAELLIEVRLEKLARPTQAASDTRSA